MKKLLIFIFIVITVLGCNPCKRLARKCPPKIHDSLIYIETITEDPNYTIPDSAFWQLEFECDSNFNVILRALEESNSGIRTETIIKEKKVYYEDNKGKQRLIVSLSAQTDSIETLNQTIEKLRSEKITVYVPEPYPKPFTPAWHWWIFVIFIVENLLIGFIIFRKFKKKLLFWR